jgi:hypothetical protein
MIHVYAIFPARRAPGESRRGLDDAAVEVRTCGTVAAAYTRHAAANFPPTLQNLRVHERVIEELMADRPVLPARFGTVFADERRLEDALARHAAALAEGLVRVRGCVELGVRVLWDPPDEESEEKRAGGSGTRSGTGRAYMLARLGAERRQREIRERAERLGAALHEPLASRAAESTHRLLTTPELLLSGAYLVSREKADEFRRCVELLGKEHPDLRILCTGPWPPYHFTPALPPAEALHA